MIDIINKTDYFSNWVFLLSLLYYLKITSFNPIILLVIISVVTFLSIIYYIHEQDYEKIEKYVFILVSIKLLPLYLLRNSKVYFSDFILSNIIFISYIIYLKYIRNVTIIEIYSNEL